jgi:hypothetical protein
MLCWCNCTKTEDEVPNCFTNSPLQLRRRCWTSGCCTRTSMSRNESIMDWQCFSRQNLFYSIGDGGLLRCCCTSASELDFSNFLIELAMHWYRFSIWQNLGRAMARFCSYIALPLIPVTVVRCYRCTNLILSLTFFWKEGKILPWFIK